jgi:hypothetical protein
MINTVSLHKTWIARTAGLFILTALAVVYFAFPMLSMAVQVQNLNVQKLKNATGVKVAFVGPVNAAAPANLVATNGVLNIVRFPSVPFADLQKGEWIAVKVTDTNPQSASVNQSFPWTCTIFSIQNQNVTCALGQPGNYKLVNNQLINRLQGTLVTLQMTPDAKGLISVKATDLQGSGWGSTAPTI